MLKSDIDNLPSGYKYCTDCMAFTPHISEQKYYNEVYICEICGDTINEYDNPCECCGYKFEEDEMYGLSTYEEVIHGDGCHFIDDNIYNDYDINQNFMTDESYAVRLLKSFIYNLNYEDRIKLQPQIDYMLEYECGCRRATIYNNSNRVSYREHSVYSQDCMNAIEWDITMRCPICGEESIFSDGNC